MAGTAHGQWLCFMPQYLPIANPLQSLDQLFMANLLGFSVFKTFCGIQMRLGHRAMIGNVFFGFGCAMGFTLFSRTGRQGQQ